MYSIDQDQTAAQVRNGVQVSELSKLSEFKKIQEGKDTPLLNGRPFENAGLPVWLYSEAFAFFLKEINAADVLPTARYLEVEGLLFSAQEIYSNEAKRVTAIKPVLATILNNQILSETIPKCLAGGLISITDGPLHAYSAILEVKNEIGTGGCDPSVQGAHSYAQCWSQLVRAVIVMFSLGPTHSHSRATSNVFASSVLARRLLSLLPAPGCVS